MQSNLKDLQQVPKVLRPKNEIYTLVATLLAGDLTDSYLDLHNCFKLDRDSNYELNIVADLVIEMFYNLKDNLDYLLTNIAEVLAEEPVDYLSTKKAVLTVLLNSMLTNNSLLEVPKGGAEDAN